MEADGAEMPRLALRDIVDERVVLQEAVQGAIVDAIQRLGIGGGGWGRGVLGREWVRTRGRKGDVG